MRNRIIAVDLARKVQQAQNAQQGQKGQYFALISVPVPEL